MGKSVGSLRLSQVQLGNNIGTGKFIYFIILNINIIIIISNIYIYM